jgi:hypothetical protein
MNIVLPAPTALGLVLSFTLRNRNTLPNQFLLNAGFRLKDWLFRGMKDRNCGGRGGLQEPSGLFRISHVFA